MSQPEALREFKEGLDQLRNHCCAEGFPDATALVLHSPDFTLSHMPFVNEHSAGWWESLGFLVGGQVYSKPRL